MSVRPSRSVADTTRSTWSALALDADATPETTEARLQRIGELGSVWPFVLFAQMLAPLVVGLIAHYSGHDDLIHLSALRGGVIAAASLAAFAQLKFRFARFWPTHVQIRTLTISSVALGVGLLSLLPLVAAFPIGEYHLAGFIAVFAAVTITAIAIHPLRAFIDFIRTADAN